VGFSSGPKSGHSLEFNENGQTYQAIRGKKCTKTLQKRGTKQRKSGTAVSSGPEIETVPLKVGQLESSYVYVDHENRVRV
jgi:hypothetical protein